MPKLGWMAILAVFLYVILHFDFLREAPSGFHQWRESDTATVAENFARRDFKILFPQINLIGANNTTQVGTELPIYTFATAAAYKGLGFSHLWPRLLSLVGAIVLALSTASLAQQIAPNHTFYFPALAAWLTLFCPLVFFYGARIQPDVWGIALVTAAAALFYGQKSQLRMILAGLCLGLAGGIKPTFFFVGLPLLVHLLQKVGWSRALRNPINWLFASLTLTPAWLWFRHARKLTASYGSAYFYLGDEWLESLRFLKTTAFYQNVLLTWPFELVIGLPMIPWFILGLWQIRKLHAWPFIVAWASGCFIVFALAAGHCATPHDYYYLPIAPCLCLIVAHGVSNIRHERWRKFSYAVILLIPLTSALRVWPRFGRDPEFWQLRTAASSLAIDSPILAVDPMPGFQLYRFGSTGYRADPQGTVAQLAIAYQQGSRYLLHTSKNGDLSATTHSFLEAAPILRIGSTALYRIKEAATTMGDASQTPLLQPRS